MKAQRLRRGLLRLVSCLGVSTLVHCGEPLLVLDIQPDSNVPTAGTQLVLHTTLNGKLGKELWFDGTASRIALRLPADAAGSVQIELFRLDAGDCKLAEVGFSAKIPGGLSRSSERSVKLGTPQAPLCSLTQLTSDLLNVPNLLSVWGRDAANVFIVGSNGTIIKCNDGPPVTACRSIPSGTVEGLIRTHGNSKNLYAVGKNGANLECSIDNSPNCHSVSMTFGNADFLSVWAVDESNVYFGGAEFIKTLKDPLPGNTGNSYTGIWGSDQNHIYAVGNGSGSSGVYRCAPHDNPANCSLISSSDSSGANFRLLYGIWGFDNNNVFAVGSNNTVLQCSATECRLPVLQNVTINTSLNSVWGSDRNRVYVAGNQLLLRCSADEKTCTGLTPPNDAELHGVWGVDSDNVFVVGNNGTALRCSAGSGACTVLHGTTAIPPTVVFRAIWGADANNIYMVGDSGEIWRRRLKVAHLTP